MKFRITLLLTLSMVWFGHGIVAQKLTLEDCLTKAENISPLSRQKLHYETLEELTQKNVSNAYLPSFFVNGLASYQSDVFSFPNNPLFESPIIPKDQYRLTLDVSQKIYDGGMTKNKKIAESARIMTESQAVEVDLYEIKATISKLFFSALIYQENIQILQMLLVDLHDQQSIINAQVQNGVVLKSASNAFKKQILSTEQQILSAKLEQQAILDMLSKWIGEEVNTSSELELPVAEISIYENAIKRPEIKLLETQNRYLESMKNMSSVSTRPMLWAVAQAGLGQPNAYNFLETEVSDFYFVGLKLSWQLFDYGNAKREKNIYAANQAIVNSKKDFVEDNINNQLTKEYAEVNKFGELLEKDEEILNLQNDIVESAFSQLKNGVITSTDYLSELNTKTQLKLTRQIHMIQLKQSEYNCLNISGNL